MMTILLIVLIVVFVDTIIIATLKTYNKMIIMKNDLIEEYKKLTIEIEYRFNLTKEYLALVNNYIDQNTVNYMNQLIESYKLKVSVTDIANSYYTLNGVLNQIFRVVSDQGFEAPEWDQAYKDSFSRIEAQRVIYNDKVLKMNDIVSMAPSNIVAKMFGFSKWLFFRNS